MLPTRTPDDVLRAVRQHVPKTDVPLTARFIENLKNADTLSVIAAAANLQSVLVETGCGDKEIGYALACLAKEREENATVVRSGIPVSVESWDESSIDIREVYPESLSAMLLRRSASPPCYGVSVDALGENWDIFKEQFPNGYSQAQADAFCRQVSRIVIYVDDVFPIGADFFNDAGTTLRECETLEAFTCQET